MRFPVATIRQSIVRVSPVEQSLPHAVTSPRVAITRRPDGHYVLAISGRGRADPTPQLLRFACLAGAILGKAAAKEQKAVVDYGRALGEAFQIADDLLDVEGDAATVGKPTGKDANAGKATFVGVLGVERARARLDALVADAETALAPFGPEAFLLRAAARFVAERRA